MKVVFTDAAEADIETIGDYIALSNPFRAVSFVREIRVKCLSLHEAPHAFPLLQIRKLPVSAAASMAST